MPELLFYPSNTDLPECFSYQANDFIRLIFDFDPYLELELYDVNAPFAEEHWHPVHFVVAERNALFSYATVMWKTLEHGGETYICYGIANMLTYPAYRQQGYGTQIVRAATDYIRSAPQADIAILWTSPHNLNFYARHGWEHMPNVTIQIGDSQHPQVYSDEPAMMLFLSEKGKRGRPAFEAEPIYFAEYTW